MSKTKSIPLSSLRYIEQVTIADLEGLKKIIRVGSPRLVKWYLVLPAVGNCDCRCIQIGAASRKTPWSYIQRGILRDYAARIVKTYQLA